MLLFTDNLPFLSIFHIDLKMDTVNYICDRLIVFFSINYFQAGMANTSETNVDGAAADHNVPGDRCVCCRTSCISMHGNCRRRVDDVKEFALELNHLCGQINVKEKARKLFTVDQLKTRVPILKWLPKYRCVSCCLLYLI